eukprot:TRINITY_DN2027_c0_g1_i1.p1 TRINITY_DN2027_c0_g1~~TRINITY_DN2027_c0_g1_i1.p1  ORF type:complete len:420 (+),score=98.44 TRINITY_DN2027_c0_g1_i1:206-1465(+)
MPKAVVLVLGDLGRSPRMQYHCTSLANNGYNVDFVGYEGTIPHSRVTDHTNIRLKYLRKPLNRRVYGFFFPILAFYKLFVQFLSVCHCLFTNGPIDIVLVQNPPCIPILAAIQFVRIFKKFKFVIDWHNLGYSILALQFETNIISKTIVFIAKIYEMFFGHFADIHLCVSNTMKQFLENQFHISNVIVHYDRPFDTFSELTIQQKHDWFEKNYKSLELNENLFTIRNSDNTIHYRQDRPFFLVTSTSYTPDEDLSIILEALEEIDLKHEKRIILAITGKGPLKEHYKELIESKFNCIRNIKVVQVWLKAEDYPKILGCADLGISLHSSSSGIDLPMKVVDMFGARLPVLAVRFKAIEELVTPRETGEIFDNHVELCCLLLKYLDNSMILSEFKENIRNSQKVESWDKEWNRTILPHVKL